MSDWIDNLKKTLKPFDSRFEYQIGDKVVITSPHNTTYSGYRDMCNMMNLPNWNSGCTLESGSLAIIVAHEMHPDEIKTQVYGLKSMDSKGNYIMDKQGFQHV
jgi:hypothetical protein